MRASKGQVELKSEIEWEKLVVVMKSVQAIAGVKKGGRVPSMFGPCFLALTTS